VDAGRTVQPGARILQTDDTTRAEVFDCIAGTRLGRTVRAVRTTSRTDPAYGTRCDAPVEQMEGLVVSDMKKACPCGCTQQVEDGCSYAGRTERDRETHRSRTNRQREARDRQRQAREAEAEGVLAEIGLDPEAPAHTLAKALEETTDRMQRLAVIVGRDLAACDVDRQRENLQATRTEHRASMMALQERLDEALGLRRATEQRVLDAEIATSQANLAAAEANAARESAVQSRHDAEQAQQASKERAESDAALTSSSLRAAALLTAQLASAEAARQGAEEAQAGAEEALRSAHREVRDQQLRTAEVLAEQERRASTTLTGALTAADRRAVRDRRSAVREVRESLLRDRTQLRAELAVARLDLEAALASLAERARQATSLDL